MALSQLESELQETRTLLQEKERDLITAAEFGKRLLDTNQELHTRLEELGREYAEKIEVGVCECVMVVVVECVCVCIICTLILYTGTGARQILSSAESRLSEVHH